jgi:hypothetical protein
LAVFLFSAFLLTAWQARANPRVVAISGQPSAGVQVRRDRSSDWVTPSQGDNLLAGFSIKTGAEPYSFKFLQGATLRLGPNSLADLRDPTQVSVRKSTEAANRLDLRRGTLEMELPRDQPRVLFVVHTNEILGVFGHGTAQARVVPEGMLAVVQDGSARVASHGRWIDLAGGQYAILGARGAAGEVKALVAAPRFVSQPCEASPTSPCAIGFVQGSKKTRLALRWQPVPRAVGFHVQIARDREMTNLVVDELVPGREFVTKPLAAGRYFATVQSMGEGGIAGRRVGPRPLRVVRLRFDPGIRHDDRLAVVAVPEGAQVHLDDVEGLEQAASGGGAIGVPSVLSLSRNQKSRTVKVRVAGNATDTATLTLEPREVRADVRLGPMTAVWPRDPISLTVRVHDPSRRFSASDVEVNIEVTVNQESLDLSFSKSGDTWRGTLAPRPGKGPWVVRVHVMDGEGRTLGRNFLEVVGQPDASNPG